MLLHDLQHFQDFLVHYDVIYKEVAYNGNVGLTRLAKSVASENKYKSSTAFIVLRGASEAVRLIFVKIIKPN